ncbi:putative ATP-dependent helicase/deoxyribonuclease subunit B [Hollandina sp. SP2]
MQRIIEMILSENNAHSQRLFVFPSEIACSRWIDRVLQDSCCGTLAMDQFITWDTFKQEALRFQRQDKEPVSPVLRKIFVTRLIAENAVQVTNGEAPWFSSLIPREYASIAGGLAPWFTAMLPELGAWFAKKTGTPLGQHSGTKPLSEAWDSIDDDLYALTIQYRQFLNDHRCFEPAWETPPFDTKGKQCFIFFPEILSDFQHYQELLENTEQVTLVGIPDSVPERQEPQTFFYTNSRNEITEAALFIRTLVENEGVPWESIAVSVPDMEHYEPYLLREFTNRNIPVVFSRGKPVASYPGGQLFSAIEACVSKGFSFDALANLLLNSHFPWKDPETIAQLMDFGIKNNCICSWEEGPKTIIDAWEDAFAAFSANREERARLWYYGLKKAILALYKAPSFGELLWEYYRFREHFFDMEQCLPKTNALLARCMAELLSIVALEKTFPDVSVDNPFCFFVEHLKETWYLAREKDAGLRVFPYRSAAAAPFDWHIVIGATQKDMSVVFSPFGFLPAGKRIQLEITDQDASGAFMHLYTLNGRKGTAFFCAQHTFSGYALPHSSLKVPKEPKIGYGASPPGRFVGDLFREEQEFYHAQQASPDKARFPQYLHPVQKKGFDAWYARRSLLRKPESLETMQRPTLQGLIQERYCQSLDGSRILRVSASAMESYYRCALYWLFDRVLGLARVRMETTLMAENMLGTVYHQVLDGFFKRVKTRGGVLAPLVQGKLPEAYRCFLEQSVWEVFCFSMEADSFSGAAMSALTRRLLQAQQRVVQEQAACFLTSFLRYFTGFRVVGSEKQLNYHPGIDPYLLTGTIDCILEDLRDEVISVDAADTGVIVDFKLRNPPHRNLCIGKGAQGLENFQLPLYLTLAEKNGIPLIHRALFFSMVPPKPQVIFGVIQDQTVPEGKKIPYRQGDRIERTDASEDTFHQILYEFNCKVRQYAFEVLSGNFSTFSTSEKKCFSCPWHTLCRTGYVVAGTRCPIILAPLQDQGE